MTITNATTQAIIRYLLFTGKFKVWRNNNGAIYDQKRKCYRKNPSALLGIPDICGYRKQDGKAFYCEVKTGKDKLRPEQILFLEQAKKCCIVFVVKDFDDFIKQSHD